MNWRPIEPDPRDAAALAELRELQEQILRDAGWTGPIEWRELPPPSLLKDDEQRG